MDNAYDGIHLTPKDIVQAAHDENVHVIGLSILSGSHLPLIADIIDQLKRAGMGPYPRDCRWNYS